MTEDRDIGPGDLIQVMLPSGDLRTVQVVSIGLVNGFPMIQGRDEYGNSCLVDPEWVLR